MEKLVFTCPVCGRTQPVELFLRQLRAYQSRDLAVRVHVIGSLGRGAITNSWATPTTVDASVVQNAVLGELTAAAVAWGLVDDARRDANRAAGQVRRLEAVLGVFQKRLAAALRASADAAGEPVVRQLGRQRDVRGAKVTDGGDASCAFTPLGAVQVRGARLLDVGDEQVELGGENEKIEIEGETEITVGSRV